MNMADIIVLAVIAAAAVAAVIARVRMHRCRSGMSDLQNSIIKTTFLRRSRFFFAQMIKQGNGFGGREGQIQKNS